jgi:CHAT domain-containing protein
MLLRRCTDESTSILMTEFYKNLEEKGMSKTEALRQAKLALMKKKKIGSKSISYSHPFLWAPFILIGQSE